MLGRLFTSVALGVFCLLNGLAYAVTLWILIHNALRMGALANGAPERTLWETLPVGGVYVAILFLVGCKTAWSRLHYVDVTSGGASLRRLTKSTSWLMLLPLLILVGSVIGHMIAHFLISFFGRGLTLGQFALGIVAGQVLGAAAGWGIYLVLWMTLVKSPFKKRPETYDR